MEIGKEFKNIYEFLERIYKKMEKTGTEGFVYFDDQQVLKYAVFDVCGKLEIKTENGNSFFHGIMKENRYYEIVKKPGRRFQLREISDADVDEKTEELMEKTAKLLQPGKYICSLSSNEYQTASIITKKADVMLFDACIKEIEKFGECDVYLKGPAIQLVSSMRIDKGRNVKDETICFMCTSFEQKEKEETEWRMHEFENKIRGTA